MDPTAHPRVLEAPSVPTGHISVHGAGDQQSWHHGDPSVHRVQCGTLFCEGGQKPPERSSCTITTYSACQALGLDDGSGYEQVLEGTKCGDERVSDQTRAWTLPPEAVRPADPMSWTYVSRIS